MKKMGKIPVRGFIARLYSATVPTVSIYGKNTLKHIYFYQYPHSPAACICEFFLKHVINKNARGIHCYSQLLKKAMISLIVLLFKQYFRTPHSPPSRGQHIDERPLKTEKARNYKRCLYARFYLILFYFFIIVYLTINQLSNKVTQLIPPNCEKTANDFLIF